MGCVSAKKPKPGQPIPNIDNNANPQVNPDNLSGNPPPYVNNAQNNVNSYVSDANRNSALSNKDPASNIQQNFVLDDDEVRD